MFLEIKNLKKTFGARKVLNGLNLSVQQGEILFVLGKSGTGKSVLLKSIVGLLKPEEGQIWIEGEEVSRLSEEDYFLIRKKCGMVFQHPALFDSLSVSENVAFGLRRHFPKLNEKDISERVARFLNMVGLRGIEHKLPQEISYGMQKRVSLARTIAIEPKILLFDEPTTGLDPVTTSTINQLIKDLSRKLNTTSIVVSHDMLGALAIADRIAFLIDGKVAALETPLDLKKSQVPLVKDFLSEVAGFH